MYWRAAIVLLGLIGTAAGGGVAAHERPFPLDTSAALTVLDSATFHGLDPEDYDAAGLRLEHDRLIPGVTGDVSINENAARAFESRLITSLQTLGRDVSTGRTQPSALDVRWRPRRAAPDVAESLDWAIAHERLGMWLTSIEPAHADYAALRRWFEDPNRTAPAPMKLSDAEAIVAINMERWRWMPDAFGERHVFVNIPSATLVVRDGGTDAITMKVVVGKAINRTPVFSGAMNAVVFSPYWNIPESIVVKEILPATRRNPGYLDKQRIEVLHGANGGAALYRQRPGPANALGLVKFVLPNDFGVYMHDTPTESAFSRAERALSHGCIRLEQPKALAEWVLNGVDDWTPATIEAAMNSGTERWVRLSASIPVHTGYFTVTAGADGALEFWRDVYGYDRRQRR